MLDVAAHHTNVAAVPARSKPIRLVDTLAGVDGCVAGAVAACAIAAVTIVDRLVTVPFLYASKLDIVIHFAAELLATAALIGLIALALSLLFALDRRIPAARRRNARGALVVLGGAAGGMSVYLLVVDRSALLALMHPGPWCAILIAFGVGAAVASYRLLGFELSWPRAVGLLLSFVALGIHLFALHRYVQHYGNLQILFLAAVAGLFTLGSGLLLGPERRRRLGIALFAGVVGASALTLGVAGESPSYSTRRAVLVWGGVAKRAVLNVVWPLFDRDGDGTPGRFWGPDVDDGNANLGVHSPVHAPSSEAAAPLTVDTVQGPRTNLLWLIIDTVRSDSFERLGAEHGPIREAFSDFARYRNYVSCSSRTSQVLAQLFRDSPCDRPSGAPAPRSLLESLRSAGYRDELLGYYEVRIEFARKEYLANDGLLVERARRRLAEPGDGRALFVHLKGGHEKYEADGNSPRERYENELRHSFELAADLVRRASRERWVVVVMGDHGEMFGEHQAFGHAATLYEVELRTPFMVRAPKIVPGTKLERFSCSDVSSKVLYGLGLIDREPPSSPHQYAALDIASGELGHLQADALRALRVGSRKAIWSPDLGIWELYDLDADPGEQHSLAESHPAELAPLRAKLEELNLACPRFDPHAAKAR